MNDCHATPTYEPSYPKRQRNIRNSDSLSTAYHGAQGIIDYRTPPLIQLDNDFEGIRLADRTHTATREGPASRFLSSLSAGSPTAAALARSGSVLHSRAKSWTSYVPKLNTTTTSPEKPSKRQSKIFGDLFNGESGPVKIGLPTSPTKEDDAEFVMEYQPGFTERPSLRQNRRESAMSSKTPTPQPSKNSWFSRRQTQTVVASNTQDDILSMNINNSLFPHGPADELSPQAFNDLLLNATNLLQRMQAAYKEKVEYISSIQPEIDAQKEEVEEAQTRSEHLKIQLEDIGRKNEEQRQVNEELIIQLSAEKMKLQEAREAAKTIRLVQRDTAGEMTDEETQRRRKRGSAGSASDSGFESDADTSSVWSGAPETLVSHRQPQFTSTPDHSDSRPTYSRTSTISQQSTAYSMQNSRRLGGEGAAWLTVEKLRHENQVLRDQLGVMQQNLQGCIDFVSGVEGM